MNKTFCPFCSGTFTLFKFFSASVVRLLNTYLKLASLIVFTLEFQVQIQSFLGQLKCQLRHILSCKNIINRTECITKQPHTPQTQNRPMNQQVFPDRTCMKLFRSGNQTRTFRVSAIDNHSLIFYLSFVIFFFFCHNCHKYLFLYTNF